LAKPNTAEAGGSAERILVITDFGEEIGILPKRLITIGFSANYHGSRIC
jgi:hypothetical protein